MGIKIQLNNEAALRKLIADDPEFELEIKRAIATNLGNTYFKEVAYSSPVHQAIQGAKALAAQTVEEKLLKEVCDFKKTSWGTLETTKLKPDTLERISIAVQASAESLVHMQINSAIAKLDIPAMVDKKLAASVDLAVRTAVQEKLKAITQSLSV